MIRQLIQTQRNVLKLEVVALIKLMGDGDDPIIGKQEEQMRFLKHLMREKQYRPSVFRITQHYLESVDQRLVSVLTEIDEIKEEAESTHKSVSVTVSMSHLC